MDIRLLPEHERFRDEVRRFLDGALDDDLRDGARFCPACSRTTKRTSAGTGFCIEQGWIAPSWPKQYGGTGWDLLQRHIWTTEASLAGAPGRRANGARHVRADADRPRHAGAARVLSAADSLGRRLLVSGLFGARRGFRSRLAASCARTSTANTTC